MNEEMLMRAQMLQKESEQIENNLMIINEHILELSKFNENLQFLEDIDNSDNYSTNSQNSLMDNSEKRILTNRIIHKKELDKEILASLGRGVYVKSKIADERKLFVEIGAGIVVKKTPQETKRVIDEQIQKFEEAKIQLSGQLYLYKEEFREMLKEIEKIKKADND